MGEQVVIDRRFNGPPDSGHGGYVCGLVAERIHAPVAAVSLRRPPPLGRPLEVYRGAEDAAALLDGGEIVADGAPATLELNAPETVSFAAAETASASDPWFAKHPFPRCFGCGPDRDPKEALRLILGRVAGRDLMADTWVPDASLADEQGRVTPLFVWATLDCPTGAAAIDPHSGPHVLARLTADPSRAPIVAGEPHVVLAWLIERDGRKSRGGSAIYDAGERLCAVAEGLWIQLRDPSLVGATV
jgi:hypothetical protein